MDLIGKKVKHNKYGEGTIIEQTEAQVSVKFVTEDAPKKFISPSCFKTFLTLQDAAAQTTETIKQHEAQEAKKKQWQREEAEARRFAQKMQEKSTKSGRTAEVHTFTSVAEFCEEYIC